MHDTSGSKLDSRAAEGRWVGFDEDSFAHRVYWPEKRAVSVQDPPIPTTNPPTSTENSTSPGLLGERFEEEHSEGRGKRVRKESEYARRLREGEGVVSVAVTVAFRRDFRRERCRK